MATMFETPGDEPQHRIGLSVVWRDLPRRSCHQSQTAVGTSHSCLAWRTSMRWATIIPAETVSGRIALSISAGHLLLRGLT